eukprot:scaffold323_cov232-Pinguiococcus_pyrenoidosus.AAC.15
MRLLAAHVDHEAARETSRFHHALQHILHGIADAQHLTASSRVVVDRSPRPELLVHLPRIHLVGNAANDARHAVRQAHNGLHDHARDTLAHPAKEAADALLPSALHRLGHDAGDAVEEPADDALASRRDPGAHAASLFSLSVPPKLSLARVLSIGAQNRQVRSHALGDSRHRDECALHDAAEETSDALGDPKGGFLRAEHQPIDRLVHQIPDARADVGEELHRVADHGQGARDSQELHVGLPRIKLHDHAHQAPGRLHHMLRRERRELDGSSTDVGKVPELVDHALAKASHQR